MHTVERARPLFGTIVAVRAVVEDEWEALAAVEDAFAELAIWQARMSAQSDKSDLASIARFRDGGSVHVDPRTAACIADALVFAQESGGVFDPVLPGAWASWRDLSLAGTEVNVARPLRLDLSGIAKGAAVDAALAVLVRTGARCGSVNAGGDLAVFGDPVTVDLAPRHSAPAASLRIADGALASSDVSAGLEDDGAPRHWDGRGGASVSPAFVSVSAPCCRDADALTKIVLTLGDDARPLLAAHNAIAYLHRPGRSWEIIGDEA